MYFPKSMLSVLFSAFLFVNIPLVKAFSSIDTKDIAATVVGTAIGVGLWQTLSHASLPKNIVKKLPGYTWAQKKHQLYRQQRWWQPAKSVLKLALVIATGLAIASLTECCIKNYREVKTLSQQVHDLQQENRDQQHIIFTKKGKRRRLKNETTDFKQKCEKLTEKLNRIESDPFYRVMENRSHSPLQQHTLKMTQ